MIISDLSSISEKILTLNMEYKKYSPSILKFKSEIKYLGRSKKNFEKQVKNLIFKS
jgi:hypothetical protein